LKQDIETLSCFCKSRAKVVELNRRGSVYLLAVDANIFVRQSVRYLRVDAALHDKLYAQEFHCGWASHIERSDRDITTSAERFMSVTVAACGYSM
jgi:hypothetical protein